MWWWTVLVFSLAVIDNISAQDDVNRTETQSKVCCPCPPGWNGETWLAQPPPDSMAASTRAVDGLARGLDDCPCRARDADSEGSASVFFTHAVRATGNVMRPDPKEDSKLLLHPEVDLAASVLETLREATDEEYRDALERDAARAAITDGTSLTDVITDGTPEEAKNVVIIVSPRDMDTDDATPEASHVQETRCIHSPLGNPRASLTYRPPPRKGLEDILNLPLPGGLLHRQRDSNLAASNIHENVVRADDNLNKMLSGLRLKTQPSLLNLDPKKIGEDINNILSGANLGNKAGNSGSNSRADLNAANDAANDQTSTEVTYVSADEIRDNFDRQSDNQAELDCNTSPTNNLETVFEDRVKNTGLLKSLLHTRNSGDKSRSSFPLKNLFKLRDVELVPLNILKNQPKPKSNVPIIKLDPLQITRASESLPKISSIDDKTVIGRGESVNIQPIPKRKLVTTDILDAVPSPSDDNCVRLKPGADKAAGEVDMEQLEDSLLNSSTETAESDDEQLIDAVAKEDEDYTELTDVSTESQQLKNSEVGENADSRETDEFELIDDTQPLEQESETDIQIISQEDIEEVPSSSIDLSEINAAEDRSNAIPEIHNPLKRLEEIRQNVVEKLDALQKSNRNALNNIKHNVEEISTRGDLIEERYQDADLTSSEDQISNVEVPFESSSVDPIGDENESAESVTIKDLQHMSDSILMASENQETRAKAPVRQPMVDSQENESESDEISESDIDNVLGMEESPKSNNDLNESTADTEFGKAQKVLCPSDLEKSAYQRKLQKSKVLDTEPSKNDLEPLASDPFIDILRPTSLTSDPIINLLRPNSKTLVEHLNDIDTKLRQSIVQPIPFPDNFNIFNTPSFNIPDISNLNANIPSLEEIRARVSEILEGLARSADDDSFEIDSDDFASEVNPVVSSGSSPPSLNSILPTLKPLEDINLDIVQLKPIPSLLGASPQTLNLPGLNLNRYKARLAIPKSLDLKPLNLASTLGNDGGLVGATLSIGPEKKAKFKPKSSSDFTKSFRGASDKNPSLAGITSSVQNNALNLLNLPQTSKGPYLQASNIIEELAENIKTHTEDTLRSVHETLQPASLNEIHTNLLRNTNNLLSSGKGSLEQAFQASTPINSVVENLRLQTESTMKHLHNTLQSPKIPDLSSVIQKNTHSILKSSTGSLGDAVGNLKAQSDNTFKNIQQTLNPSTLADISDTIHKTAQNILNSPPIAPPRDLLGSPLKSIPPIHEVADNLRSQTESTLKNIHQTLNAPSLSDIHTNIQKSAQQVLNSPISNLRPELLRSSLQPSTSIDTIVDNLNAQTENTMRTIQSTLNAPTLADISATVQKHAENLLNSPVVLTGREAFEQVLQASPPIDLAPHAEQVAKDLQNTLKATLKSSPIIDLPPLPHPNEVLQIISNHHEDVNDKLYAIHTDLTDRLETIHNEVTDPERLRSILSPPGNRNFELFAIPLPMASRSAPITQNRRTTTRPMMQAKQSSVVTQRKESRKPTSAVSKLRTDKPKLGIMRAASGKESSPSKSFRIPAASSPIPKKTSRPTLSLPPKSPFKGLQDIKKPVLPKLKALTPSKVTFGSTTPRPTPKPQKLVPTTPKPRVTNNKRFKPKAPVRQPTPWNGWGEARSTPKRLGEPLSSPSRLAANVRPPSKLKPAKPIIKPVKSISKLKTPSTPKKTNPLSQSRVTVPDSKLLSPVSKPRSPLLTKLSEAFKSTQIDQKLSTSRGKSNLGMLPAASERFEKVVPLEEPMKENVSYKCNMMCVKVDLNDES